MRTAPLVLGFALTWFAACTLDDAELEAAIAAQFAVDPVTAPYDLTVTVNRGVAQLQGQTMTRAEQHRAFQIASSVRGVREVRSRLRLLDEAIQRAVVDALRADPVLHGVTIAVTVDRGVTRLEGSNTDAAQRQRARDIAAGTDGVTAVEDFMK